MAKPRVIKIDRRGAAESNKRAKPGAEAAPLGPGIHAGAIELKLGASYRVRLLDGRRVNAAVGEGVAQALVDECLRGRRRVMLAEGERGPVILGALQTTPGPSVDAETGMLEIEAKNVRLRAAQTISLAAGPVTLTLDQRGLLRIEGDRMVIDVAALLRVLSARVELP